MTRSRFTAPALTLMLMMAACSNGSTTPPTTAATTTTTTASATTTSRATTTTAATTTTTGVVSTTTMPATTTTLSPVPTTRVEGAGFQFSYPAEWTLDQQGGGASLVGPRPPAGLPAWVLDIDPVEVAAGTDLEVAAAAARDTDAVTAQDYALLGEGDTTVGDLPARYYEFRSFGITELVTRQTMAISGTTMYVFRFTAPVETYEQGVAAAIEVIDSFELTG